MLTKKNQWRNFATALVLGICGASGCDLVEEGRELSDLDRALGDETFAGAEHGEPAADYPELVDLLDEVEGWAEGVEGGKNGKVYVVTTTNDGGSGSLRKALESSKKYWIVFDEGLDGSSITLDSPISVKSYKTIDGRGVDIRIRTSDPGEFSALKFRRQSHLIINNVTLDDGLSNWDTDGEPADGLEIEDSSYVWVHKTKFRKWKDGAIDIRHEGGSMSKNISVTWSRFEKTYQALNWTGDQMSFGHNYCFEVRKRCIKVIEGKAHSWNNVIYAWDGGEIQHAKDGAQLFSEFNVFDPQGFSAVNKYKNGGCIKNSKHKADGIEFVEGCDSVSSSFISASKGKAQRTKCQDDACWDDLYDEVTNNAGPE